MYQIRYGVDIRYTDFDNQVYTVSYRIFANDEDDAVRISKELFYMSYGTYNDMEINVSPLELSDAEKIKLNKVLIDEYGAVKPKFKNISYRDFLKSYEDFDGYDMILETNYASFWFHFMNIECQAIWKQGISYISENEMFIHLDDNRNYIVRNNLCDFYIAY